MHATRINFINVQRKRTQMTRIHPLVLYFSSLSVLLNFLVLGVKTKTKEQVSDSFRQVVTALDGAIPWYQGVTAGGPTS